MAAVHNPVRIGALWQQRIQGLRDYEVIRDGNIFRTSFSESYVYSSDYSRARRRLEQLVNQYRGIPFSEVFPGEEVTNEGGVCFSLRSNHHLTRTRIDAENLRGEIFSDLTLVRGIGEATERHLKGRGYQTLWDLMQHPRFRAPAHKVIERISAGDSADIMDLIGCRHAKSHPLVLGLAGFHEPEDYVYLDIETLGLFSRPIILFGVGVIENGRLAVYQYLLRNIGEERAALIATLGHLAGDRPALVTFNGKAFDLPYVKERLAYYGMGAPGHIPHFDVLHFSRRRWRGSMPSLRLTVLEEEILGIRRKDDIPGQMVPEFYEAYLLTGNCGPLVPVIEHNRQDVVSLALLFFRLLEESYGCC
jgi:uncharacterized protein YprB with RNaseH-like and TPR domain